MDVLRGERPPSKVVQNATYLNSARKQWSKGNIWIYKDRIVYVGQALPVNTKETEWTDAAEKYVVPGYIEHHAHPFMLYHPRTFSDYALVRGTSTIFNDNLFLLMNMEKKKALSFISEMNEGSSSLYWSCRLDSQTEIKEEHHLFTPQYFEDWLNHPLVVQGGEFSGWPKVVAGDDTLLHWMEETQKRKKPLEGHLPGASERTLAQLALLGLYSDHEAITGEEVLSRMDAGYMTTLRHSSLRPDLPRLLADLLEADIQHFGRLMLTSDGSSPNFYKHGVMDHLLKLTIDNGIDPMNAYEMASYNVACHYNMEDIHGMIAPGRVAHLNFLADIYEPRPVDVMAKGEWIVKNNKQVQDLPSFDWEKYEPTYNGLDWDLQAEDLHFSMPVGVRLVNSVLLEPYHIDIDETHETLSEHHNECFFAMIDKNGKWRMNTIIKDFASKLDGMATTFSLTGDVIMIGKKKSAMKRAFQALKAHNGGMFIVNDEGPNFEFPLPYFGLMADVSMTEVIKRHDEFENVLKACGYPHHDPLYSILFFASTHLPYVRTTPKGFYDVHKKSILFPTLMR